MDSLILNTATRFLVPLLLLFSLFLVFRGHNEPGGGFSGGLVAAAAFTLVALSSGVAAARNMLMVSPRVSIGIGLFAALGSGLPSLMVGGPLMAGQWMEMDLAGLGRLHLGTPLVFDVGVYLVVLGATLTALLPLAEE
jgi:multicomponent Na+:H+ antiporter subunit B